ncbi:hypothetical protein AB0346_00535 [Nocardia beijingensis]|uniref:hypothetical protein n=1 Tax=Nocardia beijingensis TaxID=95162 RepID=UPI00344FDCBF
MTHIINLTSHPVTIYSSDGHLLNRFPPTPRPARIHETHTPTTPITHHGIPLPRTHVTYRPTAANLPEPRTDTILLVSRVLAASYPHRNDLVFPLDEGRDHDGNIIGCRALGTFADT